MAIQFPRQGFVFWPVGTGDSSTIVINKDIILQIDLRHTSKSEENETTEWAIIDELENVLPRKNQRPYLAVFALTHPDKDHIQGFEELLKRIDIGELWHTPKVFRDYDENETLCDDAEIFRNEADRRRKAILKNPYNIASGDRLKVIGHDEILTEEKYNDLPDSCKKRPGEEITEIDGQDIQDKITVFVHAPFSDDQAKDRNNTSLALHIELKEGEKTLRGLFLGDREYPTVKKIFEKTIEKDNEHYLEWDVLLAPHHCSKNVMFFEDEDDDEPKFKKDIMDLLEEYRNDEARIVASCSADFSDEKGDNPPHQKAREKYEEIVFSGNFICTHEHPNKKNPKPLVFELTADGIAIDTSDSDKSKAMISAAIAAARGGSQPPSQQVGFGKRS